MSTDTFAPVIFFNRIATRLRGWFKNRQPSEEVVLYGTSLLVGLGAGIGAVVFRYLIQAVGWIGYTWFPSVTTQWGNAYVIIVPAIGGLIVGI